MPSSINPYNINGNYPIAGQDNDSQGFRDNFTNTRNNLVFTKSEIEDLQNKVLLKRPLSGGSVNDPTYNDLAGTILSNPQLKAWYQRIVPHIPAGDSVNADFTAGNFHHIKTSEELVSLTFSGFPIGTNAGWATICLLVEVTSPGHAVKFPRDIVRGITKIKGYDGIDTVIFDQIGDYLLEVSSYNGSVFYIADLSRNSNEFSRDDIDDGESASGTTSVTTFATSLPTENSSLADGNEGQTKTFIMTSESGTMSIAVDSAGWKESQGTPAVPQLGTITFTEVGQACQLQFVTGKWYCIGNNGATFA
jgi:hypothetical protein